MIFTPFSERWPPLSCHCQQRWKTWPPHPHWWSCTPSLRWFPGLHRWLWFSPQLSQPEQTLGRTAGSFLEQITDVWWNRTLYLFKMLMLFGLYYINLCTWPPQSGLKRVGRFTHFEETWVDCRWYLWAWCWWWWTLKDPPPNRPCLWLGWWWSTFLWFPCPCWLVLS